MLKLRSGILALTLSGAVAMGSANAGMLRAPDSDYAPVNSWTGFYIGGHWGGAFGDLKVRDEDGYAANAPFGQKTTISPSSSFEGGTLGYNYQQGVFVYGLEADVGFMDLNSSKGLVGAVDGSRAGIDSGVYGDITGRFGVLAGRTLYYAKGGFALYDGESRFSTVSGRFTGNTTTDIFTGWTVGGGVEISLTPAFSIKGEYQYFDFGTQEFKVFNDDTPPAAFHFKEDLAVNTVKLGLNYHIASGYQPLK